MTVLPSEGRPCEASQLHDAGLVDPVDALADCVIRAPIRSLEGDQIGSTGASALGKALKKNDTLP